MNMRILKLKYTEKELLNKVIVLVFWTQKCSHRLMIVETLKCFLTVAVNESSRITSKISLFVSHGFYIDMRVSKY